MDPQPENILLATPAGPRIYRDGVHPRNRSVRHGNEDSGRLIPQGSELDPVEHAYILFANCRSNALSQAAQGSLVWQSAEEDFQRLLENRSPAAYRSEQGHARAEFHIVRTAENVFCRLASMGEHCIGAPPKARAENVMSEIIGGFLGTGDRISLCDQRMAQSLELREYEPHPMRLFFPAASSL